MIALQPTSVAILPTPASDFVGQHDIIESILLETPLTRVVWCLVFTDGNNVKATVMTVWQNRILSRKLALSICLISEFFIDSVHKKKRLCFQSLPRKKADILRCKIKFYRDHHHHHYVVPQARISLTFSRHFSLSFIASGRSSGTHPVSSHSCWMYVLAGRPAFARPYVGVHRITSLMRSSLLLQQGSACLVRLTWIIFVMGGRWPFT